MSDLLIIPPDGLLNLYVADDDFTHTQVETYLRGHGEGTYVTLTMDTHAYAIGMLLADGAPTNERARAACHTLFGWHMVFTGPVAIGGLDHEQSRAVLQEVS